MLLQLTPKELDAVSSYWYLKFGTHWAGPFSYIEILQFLKARRINRTIKIRSGNSSDAAGGKWFSISELEEFSPEFVDVFCKYYVPKGRPFELVRKYVRTSYREKVMVVTEEGKIFECECVELSAGGAKIKVASEAIKEEETLKIQFFYNKKIKLKSFKATAKVLRLSEIKFDEGELGGVCEVYSVQFINLKARFKKRLLKSTQYKIKALASHLREKEKKAVEILDLNEFSTKYPHLVLSP